MGSASFGQQTNGRGDSRQHHTDTTPPIHTVELNQPSTVVAPTTGPVVTNSAPLPQNVTPANVASQIAHQADLFRLPGNRGVRIQLHPEDLGGVQVTLRYAGNGGGIELHINVEHATTGALVQAGWSELRDALATQGISPDRLVMSVTGPNTATNLDFSSGNGGGYRPDQSPSGFTPNGQSGQQRNDANFGDDSRGSRGWQPANSGPTSTSPNDDASPSVHAAGATRIDYRV
jgi:flagellar hook-length control protein FliK